MADKKISALTGASTPLAGTEVLPIVQSGATVKVAVSDLTAGRAVSATAVTASTGNLIVSTSGKGVTTGSAIPLGFGTNGSTSQATLDTSGNFSAAGYLTTGSPSAGISYFLTYGGGGKVVGAGGTLSYTMAASYTGLAQLSNASSGRTALVMFDGLNSVTTISDPNLILVSLPITKSSGTVTVTNNTGGTISLYLTIYANS